MRQFTRALIAGAIGLLLVAVMIGSASATRQPGRVPVKFGADLTTNTQPSNSVPPEKCSQVDDGDLADAACTRLMNTSEVGSPGGNLKAPSAGTITQIWVIAGKAGTFTPVVGFLSQIDTGSGTAMGKITAKGPVLTHGSSFTEGEDYTIFKFTGLHIPVKKGERLGIRNKSTSMLRCDSGGSKQFVFQPPLVVGASPVANAGTDDCSLLIEAVMTPAA
jgi:hypothetical protein